jgi:hypothetical protein
VDGLLFFKLGSDATEEVPATWRTNGIKPELTAVSSKLHYLLACRQRRRNPTSEYLMVAFASFLAFPCRDNIPGLTCCPAIIDGTTGLCGGGTTTAVTSCFATEPLSEVHSIFKPCCCQGATSDDLLFVGANMTSMRNSKLADVRCCNHKCAQCVCRHGHTQLDNNNAKIRSACFQ